MIKTIDDTDYTDITKMSYRILTREYGYTARISDIWKLLLSVYGLQEFEILDSREYQNGNFESYLSEEYYGWLHHRKVDFGEIEKAIMAVGDFTGTEKLLLGSGDMQERLWAIFICLSDPTKII
ncbi:MAG: hypothetical protein J6I84_02990 [Bacilli bacterium]|nr:hypothetical protein [Bacilli bacterium]